MRKINGMKIVDAKKPLEVSIKPADVRKAGVQNPATCAVAQAICRGPNMAEARVHISRTYVRSEGAKTWQRFMTPQNLRTEIVAFDKGAPKAFNVENTYKLTPSRPATGFQQGSYKGQTKPKQRGPKEHRTYILTDIRPNANAEFDHTKKGK